MRERLIWVGIYLAFGGIGLGLVMLAAAASRLVADCMASGC